MRKKLRLAVAAASVALLAVAVPAAHARRSKSFLDWLSSMGNAVAHAPGAAVHHRRRAKPRSRIALPEKGPMPPGLPSPAVAPPTSSETPPVPTPRPAPQAGVEEPATETPPAAAQTSPPAASKHSAEEVPPDAPQGEPQPPSETGVEPPEPTPRPEPTPAEAAPAPAEPEPPQYTYLPHPKDTPEEEAACRKQLTDLGAEFEERAALSDPIGCEVPYPLVLKTLGKGIGISPEVTLNCQMAEAVTKFAQTQIAPKAAADLGSGPVAIRQESGYVCRPRNGTEKLSEHAFGNAIDIASFMLEDGRVINVKADEPGSPEEKFLDDVRGAACGPFKTVLGPGTDADHALHFHLDLEPRHHGSTYCR